MATFLKLNRLYKNKKSKVAKSHTINVDVSTIESVRTASTLTGQKATVVTKSGMAIPVKEEASAILNAAGHSVKAVSTPRRSTGSRW